MSSRVDISSGSGWTQLLCVRDGLRSSFMTDVPPLSPQVRALAPTGDVEQTDWTAWRNVLEATPVTEVPPKHSEALMTAAKQLEPELKEFGRALDSVDSSGLLWISEQLGQLRAAGQRAHLLVELLPIDDLVLIGISRSRVLLSLGYLDSPDRLRAELSQRIKDSALPI